MDYPSAQPRVDGSEPAAAERRGLAASSAVGGGMVFFAGLSAGMFAWYALVSHTALSVTASNVALVILLAAGCGGALGVWLSYSRYAAQYAGVDAAHMRQADAYSFLPLFGLWLYVVQVPAWLKASALAAIVIGLFLAAKIIVLARYLRTVRAVAAVFVATRIPVIIIAPLAAIVIGQRQGHHWSAAHGVLLDVWGRWDAEHYLKIATTGYHGADVAFFPLYPFLIRLLGGITGDHLIAGLIISNLAFFVALAYLYALAKLEFGDENVAYHTIFYTAIFPTAIFFSAIYTESLFLALTVASVYYARHGNFITSGIFGALTSLTRVEGILLIIPLAYEIWRGWRERRGTTLARGLIGLALVPAGLAIYMAYLYALVGDPTYFTGVQTHWNRHLAWPWMSFVNTFALLANHPLASTASVNHLIELAFTLGFLALLVPAFRFLRPSYAWYFAVSLLVPLSTASLMSMPRFVLVVFPAFMMLALWGQRPAVNSAIVSFSLPLLGLFTVFYADWYWLA